MRKFLSLLAAFSLVAVVSGCTFHGGTNLGEVAQRSGLSNVTTGDGTFEDYTATGYHTGTEVGIAVGIPYLVKLMELYPKQTNEDLMTAVADAAKADGAEAMINVTPVKEMYLGVPFFIVGLYVDTAAGTGIALD
jgi:hypothetical protein